ncbi:MAG TPA: hypothetical protein VNX21_07440 [Candidatus Thermoplasmatota archaeon]|nr:hypothetical protein [Candidatus Thermoplasmatota archaeon]
MRADRRSGLFPISISPTSPPEPLRQERRMAAPEKAQAQAAPRPGETSPGAERRVAVLVAHGMGQQVPFETLDQVAVKLAESADGWRLATHPDGTRKAVVPRNVQLGKTRLRRVEMELARDVPPGAPPQTREVHVYEAYWAPLTEGQTKPLDVIAFLATGGLNGLRNAAGAFRRWVFGQEVTFGRRPGTALALLLALGTVAALVAMNLAAAAVVVGKKDWMTPPVGHALAGALAIVLGSAIALGAFVRAASRARRKALDLGNPARLPRHGMRAFAVALGAAAAFLIAAISILGARAWRGDAEGPGARLVVASGLLLAVAVGYAWVSRRAALVAEAQAQKPLPQARRRAAAALAGAITAFVALLAAAAWGTFLGSPTPRWTTQDLAYAASAGALLAAVASLLLGESAQEKAGKGVSPAPAPEGPSASDRRFQGFWLWGGVAFAVALVAMLAGPFLLDRALPPAWGDARVGGVLAGLAGLAAALTLPAAWVDGGRRTAWGVAWRALLLWALVAVALVVGGLATKDPLQGAAFAAWGLVFAGSVFVVRFLVQYLGDVAAYVSSHVLDRFSKLRDEIKAEAKEVADAVYGAKAADGKLLYGKVIVVGHSLGSVIAYDALNACLLDDDLALVPDPHGPGSDPAKTDPPYRDVAGRTKLLLTFGSPIDRTAFVFTTQARTAEMREALAMVRQPLISSVEVRKRICWSNVWAPGDIISSPLDFHDSPALPQPARVKNYVEDYAATPLASHVEYWESPLVWRLLRQHL